MKVKLLISRAGAGFVQNIGDEIEVSDAEAKRMMEASPPKCVSVRDALDQTERAVRTGRKAKP